MSFWDKFYSLCQKNAVTPSHVAGAIGVSRASVSAWKNSGSLPSIRTRRSLCKYFALPYDFNWEGENPEPSQEKPKNRYRIPVLGRVAAGIPIEQIVDVEDYEDISDAMAANGDYFALKIHGDSMQPRMCENDVIIVRKQENVENGETAVVSINGLDATCKRIEFTEDGITLISTNPAYSPMHFTQKQINDLPIRILGKVVEIRCKL